MGQSTHNCRNREGLNCLVMLELFSCVSIDIWNLVQWITVLSGGGSGEQVWGKCCCTGLHGPIWWILMGHLSKLDISIWVRFNGLPRKNLFICLPSPNILSNSSRQRLSRPLCIFELEPTSPSPSPYHEWNITLLHFIISRGGRECWAHFAQLQLIMHFSRLCTNVYRHHIDRRWW